MTQPVRSPVKVLIVDDRSMVRAALRTILEAAAFDVVGEAEDGDTALAEVARTAPDVVLMDVRMPRRDGLSATEELVRIAPEVRVLVLTTFDDDASLFGALRAGAAGFMLKNSSPEDLQRAVASVAAGDAVLDPSVTARVMNRFVARQPMGDATESSSVRPPIGAAAAAQIDRLTEREKDVLSLLGEGMTNAEIGEALGVSDATAKTHVAHVIMKLGVRDRVQAVIRSFESGFATTTRVVQRRQGT